MPVWNCCIIATKSWLLFDGDVGCSLDAAFVLIMTSACAVVGCVVSSVILLVYDELMVIVG